MNGARNGAFLSATRVRNMDRSVGDTMSMIFSDSEDKSRATHVSPKTTPLFLANRGWG